MTEASTKDYEAFTNPLRHEGTPLLGPVLWSCGLGPVVRAYKRLERRLYIGFCGIHG